MNVKHEDDVFIAEDGGTVLGTARLTDAGVVLAARQPRESVALALVHTVAAAQPRGERRSWHRRLDRFTFRPTTRTASSSSWSGSSRAPFVPARPPCPRRGTGGWRSTTRSPTGIPAASSASAVRLLERGAVVTFTIRVEDGLAVHYIAFERGRLLDEYMSVPEYRGPLAPGDAIAMRANPTVIARLTGADPAAIRRVARTADSPVDLPPAEDLLPRA